MTNDTTPLSLAERLVPSEHAIESRVGDETVLLHLETGTYYGLDVVGTRIWELLKAGQTPQEACAVIVEEFGVAPDVVETDARRFLQDLKEHAIVVAG